MADSIELDYDEDISMLNEMLLKELAAASIEEDGELEDTIVHVANQCDKRKIALKKPCGTTLTPGSTPGYKMMANGKVKCLPCRKVFLKMYGLRHHWESIHQEYMIKYTCLDCRKTLIRLDDLLVHGERMHGRHKEKKERVRMAAKGKRVLNFKFRDPQGAEGPKPKVQNHQGPASQPLKPPQQIRPPMHVLTPQPDRILLKRPSPQHLQPSSTQPLQPSSTQPLQPLQPSPPHQPLQSPFQPPQLFQPSSQPPQPF